MSNDNLHQVGPNQEVQFCFDLALSPHGLTLMLGQQKLLFKGKIRIYINLSKWIRRHGRWLCRAGKLALSTVNWAFLGLLLCFTETPFHIVNFKVERGMFWTYDQSSFGPHYNSPQTSSWKLHLSRKPGCCVGYLCNDPTRKSTPPHASLISDSSGRSGFLDHKPLKSPFTILF